MKWDPILHARRFPSTPSTQPWPIARQGSLLSEAWRARSPRRTGWQIVMPLAALAIDDAEHVAEALRARGGVEPPNDTG